MKKLLTICIALIAILSFSTNTVQADSPRMVVIEQFTNTSCGPCASANPAFHDYMEANFDMIIPLVYHWYYPSQNDPMYQFDVTMNTERAKVYNVGGVPAAVVAGNYLQSGNSTTHPNTIMSNKATMIDPIGAETSPLDITVTMTQDGVNCTADINVKSSADLGGKKLHVVVIENYMLTSEFSNPGVVTNGEADFKWVPRMMLPTYNGSDITVAAGMDEDFTFNFEQKSPIKDGNFYVVAFVQDMTTREVYQGASSPMPALPEKAAVAVTGGEEEMVYIDTDEEVEITYTVTNPEAYAVDVNMSFTPINDWSIIPSTSYFTLDPAATQDVTFTISTTKTGGTAFSVPEFEASATDAISTTVEPDNAINLFITTTKNLVVAPSYNANIGLNGTLLAMSGSSMIDGDYGIIGVTDEHLPAIDFENIIFTFDPYTFGNGYTWSCTYGGVQDAAINLMEEAFASTANTVLLDAADIAGFVGTDYRNPNADAFITKLGLASADLTVRVTYNSSNEVSGLTAYTVTANNPDGTELTLQNPTLNDMDATDGTKYWIEFTDNLEIVGSNVEPIAFYNDTQTPAAVMGECENGSFFIYAPLLVGCGIPTADKVTLLEYYLTWLDFGMPAASPKFACSIEAVDFGGISIGETGNETFTISNNGSATLTIDEININGSVFSTQATATSIEGGATWDITLGFTPISADNFSGSIEFVTNAGTFTFDLSGHGTNTVTDLDNIFTFSASPNPVETTSTISFNVLESAVNVNMTVIDLNGKTVSSLVNTVYNTGSYTTNFDASNLVAGSYFVVAVIDGNQTMLPIIVK